MRNDLPPVKDKPTGRQLRVYIRLASGAEACLYVSNEVSGQYHVLVPSMEFWITEEELKDAEVKMHAE